MDSGGDCKVLKMFSTLKIHLFIFKSTNTLFRDMIIANYYLGIK